MSHVSNSTCFCPIRSFASWSLSFGVGQTTWEFGATQTLKTVSLRIGIHSYYLRLPLRLPLCKTNVKTSQFPYSCLFARCCSYFPHLFPYVSWLPWLTPHRAPVRRFQSQPAPPLISVKLGTLKAWSQLQPGGFWGQYSPRVLRSFGQKYQIWVVWVRERKARPFFSAINLRTSSFMLAPKGISLLGHQFLVPTKGSKRWFERSKTYWKMTDLNGQWQCQIWALKHIWLKWLNWKSTIPPALTSLGFSSVGSVRKRVRQDPGTQGCQLKVDLTWDVYPQWKRRSSILGM